MSPQALFGELDLKAYPYITERKTSLGSWVPILATQSSAFLDGGVVTGDMTGNREIILRVLISAGSRSELAQAAEALVSQANQPSNTLILMSDDMPAQVFETYRASSVVVVEDVVVSPVQRMYEIHLPAKPFVRSLAREYPAAAAPTVILEGFEGSPQGVAARSAFGTFLAAPGAESAAPILSQSVTSAAFWGSVSGATVAALQATYDSTATWVTRFTGSGLVEAVSSGSWSVAGADWVTVALRAANSAPGVSFLAGLEWLDAGGVSLGVVWGQPLTAALVGVLATVWVTDRKPAGTVSVRVRLRIPALSGTVDVANAGIVSVGTLGAMPFVASNWARTGGLGVGQALSSPTNPHPTGASAFYVAGVLPAAADVSEAAAVGVWLRSSVALTLGTTAAARLRLLDVSGAWAAWDLTGAAMAANVWVRATGVLASPTLSSGTVDLTAVVAWDLSFRGDGASSVSLSVDDVHVGPVPSPLLSTRGTVLTLGIRGSAPSPAAVVVSSATAMTDWLVACIDGTTGEPLLSVTSNVATAPAPAGYGGTPPPTYQVIGCVSPATALTSPTCTVAQRIAGTTVATRVLTGTQHVGNRYVDFGVIELPMIDVPAENQSVSYTFTLAPSSTSWTEVLVIDTDAALAWIDGLTTAHKIGWVDEPSPLVELGKVWVGDAADRSDARAPDVPPAALTRPLQVRQPSTQLLVFSTSGAPDVALDYARHYVAEVTD